MSILTGRRAEVIQVTAEERRRDRAAALDLRREELALEREQRQEKQKERMQRRFARRHALSNAVNRVQTAAPAIGRTGLIAGPILAPMAVAWIGQIQFATDTLGWTIAGALVFAAAWELTTAFAGWMFHQARAAGDRGLLFRWATWLFACSAGAMNYWHALGNHNSIVHPTPKAVSYGAMSLVGISLWELYASLIHRRKLRDDGKLPAARPRFGVARWVRYPRLTWSAWSLTIRHQIPTSDQAWSLAVAQADGRPAAATGVVDRSGVRVVVGRMTVVRDRPFHRPGDGARRPVLTTSWGGFSLGRMGGNDQPADHAQRPVVPAVDHPGDRPNPTLNDQPATTLATTPQAPAPTTRARAGRPPARKRSSRPTPVENQRAVDRYVESCRAGAPLSERDLAREFGRSKGWARDRIQQAGPQPVIGRERPVETEAGRPATATTSDHADDHSNDRTEATG